MRGNIDPVDEQSKNNLEEVEKEGTGLGRQQEAVLLDKLTVLLSDDLSEGVNPNYLEDIFQEYRMKVPDGNADPTDYGEIFLTLLDRSLILDNSREKVSQIDLFSKVYPYIGSNTVQDLDTVIPKLIVNLVCTDKDLKRATLNALHVCIKHSSNRVEILRSLVKHGVEIADTKTRTEVMVSLPVLITADVAKEDLFEIVFALVRRLGQSSVKNEHNPPSLLCLERLKEVLGESFHGYIQRLPKQLQLEYKVAMENHKAHLPNSTPHSRSSEADSTSKFPKYSTNGSNGTSSGKGYHIQDGNSRLYYGIIPQDVMSGLVEEQNWRSRGNAMENLATIIRNLEEVSVILPFLDDLLAMIIAYLDDSNFKIQMLSLEVVADVVGKVNTRIIPHAKIVMDGVIRKFGDGKSVVKQAVNRVILRLMQNVGPSRILDLIYPLANHRNSKVRQDTVDIITIALLTFPSSEFDLTIISTSIAPLLLDTKRKIRQGVLECYSLLAQALGQGKLNPIVTAVDAIELRSGGDGVMEAVQARLARRQLPKLKPDGLVEYALPVPPGPLKGTVLPPDVDWILKASGGGEGSAKSQSADGVSTKRYFSAGKRRLPWEMNNETELEPRKTVGSAPLRPKPPASSDENRMSMVTQDTWMTSEPDINYASKTGDVSYLGKYVLKNKMPGLLVDKPELNRSESQGSYFKMYKSKMKRLKQAGLQADQNMMASVPSQSPGVGGYALMYKKGTITGRKGVNGDAEVLSKAGTQSLSPIRPPSLSPENIDDQRLSSSWSGAEAFEQFDGSKDKGKRLDLRPIGLDSPGHSPRAADSPVCIKPQLARSASKKRSQAAAEKAMADKNDVHRFSQTMKNSNMTQAETSIQGPNQGSPFDSKPRLVRTPSGKLSSGKWKSLERLTPISRGERVQRSVAVDANVSKCVDDISGEQFSSVCKRSVSAVSISENSRDNVDVAFLNGNISKDRKSPARKSNVVVDNNNNNSSFVENANAMNDLSDLNEFGDSCPVLRKSSSGLSKSALERAEKKRLEEKRKWEMEQQMKEDKRLEMEEKKRLRDLGKQRELEQRKQEVAKSLEEIKKLENLILSKKQAESEKEFVGFEDRGPKETTELIADVERETQEEKRQKDEQNRQLREEKLKLEMEKKKLEQDLKKDELRRVEKRLQVPEPEHIVQSEAELTHQASTFEGRPADHGCDSGKEVENLSTSNRNEPKVNVTRSPRARRYESFDIDVNDMKFINEVTEPSNVGNVKPRRPSKNNGYGKPPVSNSPRPRRKNASSPTGRSKAEGGFGIGSAGTRSCVDSDACSEQQPVPLSNPENSFKEAIKQLGANAEDWDLKCSGLHTIRCLAMHHPEILVKQLHTVAIAVAAEVKNLRSQVTRTSLACLADMFLGLGRTMEPEADEMARILLSKSADTNVFIRQDAEKALTAMMQSVSPKHAIMALINGGACHKSKDVRKVCARLLSQVTEGMGFSRLLNGTKDITDRVVPTASQFALDGQQETRYYGRKMLFLMMEHPDFEKLLEKHVLPKNQRPIKDLVQNLKTKGLGEPPNMVSSAGVRKSFRQSDSATTGSRKGSLVTERNNDVAQSNSFRNGSGNGQGARTSSHKAARRRSREDSIQSNVPFAKALDMDVFAKLTSNDWKDRMDGIDAFCDVVESNPDGVAASIVKVFDRFGPRLTDSNSKVLVYAVQTLSRVTPILGDGLIPVLTMTVQNLQGCIASKNELVYTSAANALDTLVRFVDCVALVPPLLSAIQFGNSRVKPEMASRMAEIVPHVFSKKPNLIGKSILPMFWNLLNSSSAGSAGAGRNDLTSATTKLANQLYLCHGESLVDDAESQGSRVKQRLVYFLGNGR